MPISIAMAGMDEICHFARPYRLLAALEALLAIYFGSRALLTCLAGRSEPCN